MYYLLYYVLLVCIIYNILWVVSMYCIIFLLCTVMCIVSMCYVCTKLQRRLTECNCDAIGSRDNFCEVTTGQCLCLPNVFGRQCDECQQGFWGFPNCRRCQCNGRADACDNVSGQCLYCRDNTGGHHCER